MICTIDEFDYRWFANLPIQHRNRGNQGTTQQKYYYVDIVTAFDIETTYIKEIDNSVMYIWQWQFGDKCTVIGRTWHELRVFMEELKELLGDNRLFIGVHNLSFEFQYLSGVFSFNKDDVFCTDHRKVLKALLNKSFEFRCTYLQTNMSLRAFCEKMGVRSYKLKLNYKKRRYWYTQLSPKELAYCVNDVRGLVEAITKEMERDNDNFYTLPLTSTGYARRDAKAAMRRVSKAFIKNQLPEVKVYKMLREAFRGGNTHASRFYAGQILADPDSMDLASAYPAEILLGDMPVSKFTILKSCDEKKLDDLIFKKHKAVLFRCRLYNVELIDDLTPVPYLATSKCRGVLNGAYDNGRILSAQIIAETTLTDLDYRIIRKQYKFDMEIVQVATARYGKLPAPLRDVVLKYYKDKTELKGRPGDAEHNKEFYKLMYDKQKNLLNAQYGMMAQSIKDMVKYINFTDDEHEKMYDQEGIPLEELVEKHNKRAYLAYQWGV